MADDLKTTLKKVLASEGKKKFFFAYGLGKRNDGKGDGELTVRLKKFKKTDVEEELADCKEVYEGFCWTGKDPATAETVYFQAKGKKLSNTILAKMMITAKRTAGRQYEFQMPPADEEARADKLVEEDGDEGATSVPPAPPLGPGKSPTPKPKPEPKPSGDGSAAKRLNAMTADIKVALDGPQRSRVQTLVVAANGLIKNNDFVEAGNVLDELESLLAKTLAGPDLSAEWKETLAKFTPAIKSAMTVKVPNAAEISKLLSQATVLAKPGGDIAQALDILTECHTAAGEALSAIFKQRLQALQPSYKTALGQAREKNPELAEDLDSLFAQIFDEAKAKKFETALKTLADLNDMVNSALKGPVSEEQPSKEVEEESTVENQEKGSSPKEDETPGISDDVLKDSSALWDNTRKQMQADLDALEKKIVSVCEEINANENSDVEIDMEELEVKVRTLHDEVLENLDERLLGKLAEALDTDVPKDRRNLQKEAAAIVKEYLEFASKDPRMSKIDANGFENLQIQQKVTTALNDLASKL